VVGDAFDPFNKRDAFQIYGSPKSDGTYAQPEYQRLLSTTGNSPRAKGYDIIFVDFSQGGGDILINASLLLKLTEWLHSATNANIMVGGPSMSGIVSRLALLYSKPGNNVAGMDLALGW
jgi:hypothetical protein